MLEKAATATQALARASGHDAAMAAGDVLSALGDALEALPGGARARDQIVEVRFQAKRLRRSDGLSFGLAKWIEEGLTAALDGLDRSAPSGNCAAYWIGAARTGLKSIDSRSSLTFQRGPVQDAARTTVDAFLIVVRGPCSCSDPRSSGTGQK